MKRTIFLLTTVFAATAVLAWAGIKTKSDWDKTVDFSSYSTWNLSKGSVPPSTVIKAIVNEGVEEVMAAKGYTRDTADPDLIIIPYGHFDQALRTEHFEWGYGTQPGGGGGWHWGGSGFTMRDISTGSIVVDVVDAKTDILVWRGLAEGDVHETADYDKRIKRIKKAVKKLMKTLPKK